jgi:hypothetical protein
MEQKLRILMAQKSKAHICRVCGQPYEHNRLYRHKKVCKPLSPLMTTIVIPKESTITIRGASLTYQESISEEFAWEILDYISTMKHKKRAKTKQ